MTTMERQPEASRPWWRLARAGFLALICLLAAVFVVGLVPRFGELARVCDVGLCAPLMLSPPDAAALSDLGISPQWYAGYQLALDAVIAGTAAALALLIFRFGAASGWMGLLTAFVLILLGLGGMVESDNALVRLYPVLVPAFNFLTILSTMPFLLLCLLFPSGSFVPRWTRWFAVLILAPVILDPLIGSMGLTASSGQFSVISVVILLAILAIGIWAQLYRYRAVSTPTERQQTKWVILGMACLVGHIIIWTWFVEVSPPEPGYATVRFTLLIYTLTIFLYLAFPASMFLAIMRYRLWDIDVIIRKTLVYATLTASLALVYFSSVIAMQNIAQRLTGEAANSPLIIVASTLLIAALFTPLRRRLQRSIDRRFFRQQYDAQKTLAAFARTARDEVELDELSAELVRVVEETMQPETVRLWLR